MRRPPNISIIAANWLVLYSVPLTAAVGTLIEFNDSMAESADDVVKSKVTVPAIKANVPTHDGMVV